MRSAERNRQGISGAGVRVSSCPFNKVLDRNRNVCACHGFSSLFSGRTVIDCENSCVFTSFGTTVSAIGVPERSVPNCRLRLFQGFQPRTSGCSGVTSVSDVDSFKNGFSSVIFSGSATVGVTEGTETQFGFRKNESSGKNSNCKSLFRISPLLSR